MVENDHEQAHVAANAKQIAASSQMLTALKAADEYLIEKALKQFKLRGYDVSWAQAEKMFGVTDLHAQIRTAIQAAEGGR
jgi:hypothetical protein